MKRFCRHIAGFLMIQGLIFALILTLYDSSDEANYLAATCDKHAQLRRATRPRLILVGGSNLAFGIDSARLGRALDRDSVNMGLAAGLGLDFMLNEIESALKAGDIVVLSLEFDRFSGGYSPLNLQQIIQYRPVSIRYLELRQWNRVLVRGGLPIVGGIVRRALGLGQSLPSTEAPVSPVYARSGFNRWGDLVAHYGQPSSFVWPARQAQNKFRSDWLPTPQVEAHLRRFAGKCAEKGVIFAYSCPPQPPEILSAERPTITAILQRLHTIPDLRILDSPDDQVYPSSLFFDTGYHLTRKGAEERTAKMTGALWRLLKKRPDATAAPSESLPGRAQ